MVEISDDIILKNGLVVDPQNGVKEKCDLAIQEGKITAIGQELNDGNTVIDLCGKLVIPGVIDSHVHNTSFLGGQEGYKMMALSGVTTAIDFGGPVNDVYEGLLTKGCGLNIGVIQALVPGYNLDTRNPSYRQLEELLQQSLENGALGYKLMGGHYPLTPEATEAAISLCNTYKCIVAFHAGSTETKSDMTGMREAIELSKGKKLLLAHINAYCRGNTAPPLLEMQEAFEMLRNNQNIYSEAHMALINGTSGKCNDGVPESEITKICLKRFGFSENEAGLKKAILKGVAKVHRTRGGVNILESGAEAVEYWKEKGTQVGVSFPANLPTVAIMCFLERNNPYGDFLIHIHSTDGGGIPRNNLLSKGLSLVNMGYLTIEEMIQKICINPAKMFALENKGQLGVGADADVTILNAEKSKAEMSIGNGKFIMINGVVVGKKGQIIISEAGIKLTNDNGLNKQIVDLKKSLLYQ